MKKIIFTLVSLLLMTASPVSAQETAEATSADKDAKINEWQKKLDEGGNAMGIRVEDYEMLYLESLHEDSLLSGQSKSSRMKRSAALWYPNADRIVISYMSLDGKMDSIRLSAVIYTRSDHKFDKILLNCHPTVTSLFEAPSGGSPVDADIRRVVDDNYMVVCPDYCGYGMSAYRQHPYLIHDVTARNCADAAMAAKVFGKRLQGSIPESFRTFIVGYSQGGATALACAKYLESDACPENYKSELKLSKTVCGDGPYSTLETLKTYLEKGTKGVNLEYPCVLPLIVMAAKDAFANGCMRTVEVEDYFSEEFKNTGILNMLKNKSFTTVDLNREVGLKMKNHLLPTDLFSDKIIDKQTGDFNKTTNEYRCLIRALETNELAKGWEPQHPITFFHLENDGVVPYSNYQAVFREDGIRYKKDGSPNENVKTVPPDVIISNFLVMKASGLPYHYAGSFEYQQIEIDKLNHATGGTWFYILYLFKNGYLR